MAKLIAVKSEEPPREYRAGQLFSSGDERSPFVLVCYSGNKWSRAYMNGAISGPYTTAEAAVGDAAGTDVRRLDPGEQMLLEQES